MSETSRYLHVPTLTWKAINLIFIIGALRISYAIAKNNTGHCASLQQNFKSVARTLEVFGEKRRLVIMSTDRAPSRAAAALLKAALRYRYGYAETYTRIDNRTNCELASTVTRLIKSNDSEMFIHIDADWKGGDENCDVLRKCEITFLTCNVAGFRMEAIGAAVAVNTPMHVRLTEENFNKADCKGADQWHFFRNQSLFSLCGFQFNNITLLVSSDVHDLTQYQKLTELIEHIPYLKVKHQVARTELIKSIRNENNSFLFIDFDLWRETDLVRVVEGAPAVTSPTAVTALRVADMRLFQQYAPIIMRVLSNFTPKPNDLRQVLEEHTHIQSYDEAACYWANDHKTEFDKWTNVSDDELMMMVILCEGDKANAQYLEMLDNILNIEKMTLGYYFNSIDCSNKYSLSNYLTKLKTRLEWQHTMGVLAPGSGAMAACNENHVTALIIYDVPPARADLGAGDKTNTAATTSTGRLQPLARATILFLTQQGWRRLAVISETSPLAEDFFQELKNHSEFALRHKILKEITPLSANAALVSLKKINARIFFLNTGPRDASIVICEAAKLGMTQAAGYAWVAREWHWNDISCDAMSDSIDHTQVFTVSYKWRGGDTSLIDDVVRDRGDDELREAVSSVWGSSTWPPSAAPMADAFVMMQTAVKGVLKTHPEDRYDIHANKKSWMFADELRTASTPGITQNLIQKDYALKDPLIFVSAWNRNVSQLLAVWRAHDSNINKLKILRKPYEGGSPPDDGSSGPCLISQGDTFSPKCYDIMWAMSSVVIVILAALIVLKTRQNRIKKFKKREKALCDQLHQLEKQLHTTSQQINFIDRSALRLFENLGSGHYGLVRSGLLIMPNRDVPERVAVKALRKHPEEAEEAEFIREAKALATLAHENVVRLVGVCAGDGQPPLLLMEHAFFGDLLHYLRERRYLLLTSLDRVSNPEENPRWAEACFVSARELTRLVREAATALAHLRSRHLLHRDLRAANCLIDSTRTLKLADFGLVHWMKTSDEQNRLQDGDYEYVLSQRTRAFAVRWMAPESIIRGEFSYASDVWALGVLMLEVITLGATPYGDWSANRVIEYVELGGRPQLPRDVSMHTIEVTNLCFARKPEKRASPECICHYLSEYPEALVPANREPDVTVFPSGFSSDDCHTDSGFGERAPDANWPLPTDPSISTI